MDRIARLLIPSGWAAVASALVLAAPAHAAATTKQPTPVTEHASRVTATGAVLHGVINTHGQKTDWQFQFGRTTAYGRATPLHSIPAGRGTTPVSAAIGHLTPGTTYDFRLVAVVASSKGVKRIYGRNETLKTRSAGRVLLEHTLLVVRNGRVTVPLRCDSTTACAGHYRIDTRAKVKGTFASVLCAAGSFSLAPRARGSVTANVRAACVVLLRASRHHQMVGKLHLHPSSGQPSFTRRVLLVLR
jgi:hypothetical protein